MHTPFHLTGKTILVTGASSGIGRQVAVSVAQMGGHVVLTGTSEERLEETRRLCNDDAAVIIAADLIKAEARETLAAQIPKLDGLVHCAGFVHSYPTRFLTQEKMDETMNINYEAPVLLMAAIQKHKKLNANASLVFITSICSEHPYRGGALYGSSKAGMETFSKVLALELSDKQIRSNCIAPAMVKTPMFDKAESETSKEMMDKHIEQYLLGAGLPEDVANTAIFLLSPASRWITGETITLDGGLRLNY